MKIALIGATGNVGSRVQYGIRINDQWRTCFEWPEGSAGPVGVEIVDYH